jgi:uncharacterized protein YecT (DUF1311 family)
VNRKLIPAALCAVLFAALVLPGCSGNAGASSAAQSETSSAVSSAASAEPQSEAPESKNSVREDDSSSAAEVSCVPQGQDRKAVCGLNAAFLKKFKENTLDSAYEAEMKDAVSTLDMVKVATKYAGLWDAEVAHASELLQAALKDSPEKKDTAAADQKTWEDGKAAALQKIADDAAASGGSISKVDAATGAMDYSRNRAYELYRQLYDYNQNFAFANQ